MKKEMFKIAPGSRLFSRRSAQGKLEYSPLGPTSWRGSFSKNFQTLIPNQGLQKSRIFGSKLAISLGKMDTLAWFVGANGANFTFASGG